MNKKVMVVMGGFSSERDVSLVSGRGVVSALIEAGYDVCEYDLKNAYDFASELKTQNPDVVFNALHGTFGEDGAIQGFLDIFQIPYTHSNIEASAIGMNKSLTKKIAKEIGIKVADSETTTYKNFLEKGTKISMPYVLKPVSDGSSVGVFIIRTEDDLKTVEYKNQDIEILVEKFISGKELTSMVLQDKSYCVTELRTVEEFYDYKAKYTDGVTQHFLPAPIPNNVTKTCMEYATKIHKALGCNTLSRSDFRYNEDDGVVFLEINTNPGLTPLSLVPEQAKYEGISYSKLCKILVENAHCKKI